MILTTAQVAQKLGIGPKQVTVLVRRGQLTPLNPREEGKSRVVYRFDSKAVNAFKATFTPRKHRSRAASPAATRPIVGIVSILNSIDGRLGKLEKRVEDLFTLWS